MDVLQFIGDKGSNFTVTEFYNWMADVGIDNIKKSDLDLFIEKTGLHIISVSGFDFIYNIVSTRENNLMAGETNNTMLTLTKVTIFAAISAIVVAVVAIVLGY